jgi:acyl-CoA synthetase (AMP-forming)/AMP-acid ligase II
MLKATVVLRENARATAAELRRHCAELLPPHMVPAVVEFRDTLPLMSTGKIDRSQLAEPPAQTSKPAMETGTDAKRIG